MTTTRASSHLTRPVLFWLLSSLAVSTLLAPTPVIAQDAGDTGPARTALEQGDPQLAVDLITQLLVESPSDPDAFVIRALAYEQLGQFSMAKRDIDTAFSLAPQRDDILSARERITALRQSDIQTEIDTLTRRLNENPDDPEARLLLAESLYSSGQFAMAADHYGMYLDTFAPTTTIAHRYLDALTRDTFNHPKGESEAAALAVSFPNDSRILAFLGFFQQLNGKDSAALESYNKSLALNPGEALAIAGSRALSTAVGNSEEPGQNLSISEIRSLQLSDPKLALTELDKLIGNNPADEELLLEYAEIAVTSGEQLSTAELYMSVLLAESEYNGRALYQMARLKAASGEYEEAGRYIRRAQALPDDYGLGFEIDELALSISDNLDSRRAEQLSATLERARTYAANGQFELAATQYDVYLREMNRWPADIVIEASDVLGETGNYLLAISYLELVEAPRPLEVDVRIADFLLAMGRPESALKIANSLTVSDNSRDEIDALRQRIAAATRTVPAPRPTVTPEPEIKDTPPNPPVANTVNEPAEREERTTKPMATLASKTWPTFVIEPVTDLVSAQDDNTEFTLWSRGGSARIRIGQLYTGGGFVRHSIDDRGKQPERLNTLSQAYGMLGITTLSRADDIRLILGVSDYETDRQTAFWYGTFTHHVPGDVSGTVFVERDEASLLLRAPLAGGADLVRSRAGLRVYSAAPYGPIRYDISASLGKVKREPAPEEEENANDVAHVSLELGTAVSNNVYFGGGYYQLDFKREDPRYYSPSFFRAYEGWLEYALLRDESSVTARASIGNAIDGNLSWVPSFSLQASRKLGISSEIGFHGFWGTDIRKSQIIADPEGFETKVLGIGLFVRYAI